jgi:hypothetical protein
MKLRMVCRLLVLVVFVPAAASIAAPVYFVVSELPGQEEHHDSYIVPLENPADIAHARDLIARGAAAGETIVVANIAAGSDGINRNEVAPGKPLWNWHVTSFESFADVTIEILDGWPSDVAKDVPAWIANTNGAIGFWSYTITAELTGPSPSPVPLPAGAAGGAFLFGCASIAGWIKKSIRR